MTDIPPDRRERPRVGLPGRATIVRVYSDERFEVAIRDLSAGGARLVGHGQLVDGDRIRLVLDLDGVELSIAADVVRTDPQNAQVAVAFRDVSREAQDTIDRSIAALIERVRATSPPTVFVLCPPDETRGALERDLARLGRCARPCTTMLETMWALHDPVVHTEAIVISSDLQGEPLGALLEHFAEHHPQLRRILVFGGQLSSVDHRSSSRVDAVLRTPLRIRALARALGIRATDGSVAMLPQADPDA